MKELILQFCLAFGCSTSPTIVDPISYIGVPRSCIKYVDKIKEVSKNPSRELALTWQESRCDRLARSAFAKGLRQFTDRTGRWASRTICRSLGSYRPYDPNWSISCGVIYIEWLESKTKYSYCLNRKVAEQRYNGGAWVLWEMKTGKTNDLNVARKYCGKPLFNGRKRAGWACSENYEYPIRISRHQKKFKSLGGKLCN